MALAHKIHFLHRVASNSVCAGAGAEKPAAHQHGAGWGHPKPRLLTRHGPRRSQHDDQQLGPFLEQVETLKLHFCLHVVVITS